jgi:hypothetical protein
MAGYTSSQFGVGRVTPCAPQVANTRVRLAEDYQLYQFYHMSL